MLHSQKQRRQDFHEAVLAPLATYASCTEWQWLVDTSVPVEYCVVVLRRWRALISESLMARQRQAWRALSHKSAGAQGSSSLLWQKVIKGHHHAPHTADSMHAVLPHLSARNSAVVAAGRSLAGDAPRDGRRLVLSAGYQYVLSCIQFRREDRLPAYVDEWVGYDSNDTRERFEGTGWCSAHSEKHFARSHELRVRQVIV